MGTRMPARARHAHRLEAWTVAGDLLGSWEGPDASDILALVANFPTGEPMRCYSPEYAIWAHSTGGDVLFDLEFCYECHRVGVREQGDRQRLVAFNAGSSPAQELLARFKAFISSELG
ncbi:hypothetical protein [Lentzea sp. NPDC055074]